MFAVFYTVNLCIFFIYDLFHILLFSWHTNGYMEYIYIYIYMCVCVYARALAAPFSLALVVLEDVRDVLSVSEKCVSV